MSQRMIAGRGFITAILICQIIPLMLFPLASLSPSSQEWWLPVMLTVLVLLADVQLIARHSTQVWPWHLLSFAQGFNIISRLMMIWPHTTRYVDGVMSINFPYVLLTVVSLTCSGLLLWYMDLPEVRLGLVR